MKAFKIFGVLVLVFSQVSCGTLLYPERQGQTSGRLDPAVVVLDGVGVLLYLIPGLVAFAIDFHQGTIYLPNSSADTMDIDKNSRTVQIVRRQLSWPVGDNYDGRLGDFLCAAFNLV